MIRDVHCAFRQNKGLGLALRGVCCAGRMSLEGIAMALLPRFVLELGASLKKAGQGQGRPSGGGC